MFPSFDSQLKILRQNTFTKVDTEVKKIEKRDLKEVCDNLGEILSTLITSNLNSFIKNAQALVIEHSGWDSKLESHRVDLND